MVTSEEISVRGTSAPDATVSVNGQLANIQASGEFETVRPLFLEEGPNIVEVIATDLSGEVRAEVLVVIRATDSEGLLGEVTNIQIPFEGVTFITIRDEQGELQRIEAAEATAIVVPGKLTASSTDISLGDVQAVLGTREGSNTYSGTAILVKPLLPTSYAHLVGSAVGTEEGQVTPMDGEGNVVVADPLPSAPRLISGEIVTAVLRRHLRSGGLFLTGAERASQSIGRLSDSLQAAVGANIENLGHRLGLTITGHLTTLKQIEYRVDRSLTDSFESASGRALADYTELQDGFNLGPPSLSCREQSPTSTDPRALRSSPQWKESR